MAELKGVEKGKRVRMLKRACQDLKWKLENLKWPPEEKQFYINMYKRFEEELKDLGHYSIY